MKTGESQKLTAKILIYQVCPAAERVSEADLRTYLRHICFNPDDILFQLYRGSGCLSPSPSLLMSLCINPLCPNPENPEDQLFCCSCESEILIEGRYRVIRRLGEGGFGRTFEVSDLDSKDKVLKILSKNDAKYVELFRREAQVLSQLDHPGIPAVEPNAYFEFYARNISEPLHCLVMEKIAGLDLQKYLRQRGGPIDSNLAVNWLIRLTKILQEIHAQQFLHRDIKPSNIMLRSDGHLALIDFGTVRSITNVSAGNQHSTQATRIMSALYTPIEQMKGKPVPQSDFFALGRTFIYLLTGQELNALYDADSDELIWRDAASDISPLLAVFLERLTAPLASQRPANAEAVLRALADIQKELPMSLRSSATTTYAHSSVLSQPLDPPSHSRPEISLSRSSSSGSSSAISEEFVGRCRQTLADLVGPIAAILCQRALRQEPTSKEELIEILARQISSESDAQIFRNQFDV